MGLDPKQLGDNVLGKIADPAEQKRLGRTSAERITKRQMEDESKLRGEIMGFCRRNNLVPVSPHPKKRSTIQIGACDLFICGPVSRVLPMELKVGYNTLSDEQKEFHRLLTVAQCKPYVVRDYADGIRIISEFFDLGHQRPA